MERGQFKLNAMNCCQCHRGPMEQRKISLNQELDKGFITEVPNVEDLCLVYGIHAGILKQQMIFQSCIP